MEFYSSWRDRRDRRDRRKTRRPQRHPGKALFARKEYIREMKLPVRLPLFVSDKWRRRDAKASSSFAIAPRSVITLAMESRASERFYPRDFLSILHRRRSAFRSPIGRLLLPHSCLSIHRFFSRSFKREIQGELNLLVCSLACLLSRGDDHQHHSPLDYVVVSSLESFREQPRFYRNSIRVSNKLVVDLTSNCPGLVIRYSASPSLIVDALLRAARDHA